MANQHSGVRGNQITPTRSTNHLAQLCKARGLTRTDLIVGMGCSDKTLDRMFNRPGYKLSAHYRMKLANLLGVHPNELTP